MSTATFTFSPPLTKPRSTAAAIREYEATVTLTATAIEHGRLRLLADFANKHSETPVRAIGPHHLQRFRRMLLNRGGRRLVSVPGGGKVWRRTGPLRRRTLNLYISHVIRFLEWADARGYLATGQLERLREGAFLPKGSAEAPDYTGPKPPDPESVAALIEYVPPSVAAMVELQRLTGMKPVELCDLKAIHLDKSGEPWIYSPPRQRSQRKVRRVTLDARAQAVLIPFLPTNPYEAVFSPRKLYAERLRIWKERARRPADELERNRQDCIARRRANGSQQRPYAREFDVQTYGRVIRNAFQGVNRRRQAQGLPLLPHVTAASLANRKNTNEAPLQRGLATVTHTHQQRTEVGECPS